MPELPEVETVVRGLTPRLAGRRIVTAEMLAPRITRHCRLEPSFLQGKRIVKLERRGKFIVIHLDAGALVIHLGMTGRLSFDTPRNAYTRAIFDLGDSMLVYDDTRMFGSIEWDVMVPERVERLGREPLEIELEQFYKALHRRTAPIKALLLNQTIVRGVGNIYADEALFRAGIPPRLRANRVTRARMARLHAAIQEVLQEAIELGGSSIINYRDSEGREGSFQIRHRVYGREGQPCVTCGSLIRRVITGGRSSHYCPACQKS